MKLEDIDKLFEERGIEKTPANIHRFIDQLQRYNVLVVKRDPDYVPKEYASKEFGMTAYTHVLDHGSEPMEAMLSSAREHGKDGEWVEDVKNRDYYYAAENVVDHDEHPVQKRMMRDGTMDRQSLKGSRSVNQQMRKLHQQRALQARLDSLEDSNDKLEGRVRDLEIDKALKDLESQRTREILDFTVNPKDLAALMKERGHSQKEVAKATEKGLRTVKRWWPDL